MFLLNATHVSAQENATVTCKSEENDNLISILIISPRSEGEESFLPKREKEEKKWRNCMETVCSFSR